MYSRFYYLIMTVNAVRLLPHIPFLLLDPDRKIMKADLLRWADSYDIPRPRNLWKYVSLFVRTMAYSKEYRNIFYLRVGGKSIFFSWLCPRINTMFIDCPDIGPGLFIQHGIGTLISAERIGANCWINQQVTIGFSNRTDRPTIGSNVKIHAGAKIIGKVKIGDGAIIGLNTVVISDVPTGASLLGVPGKIIWRAAEPSPTTFADG